MEKAEIVWREGPKGRLPVSTQFDDPYYALLDGLAETNHVFLKGNGLPERFFDGMTIAELGFGTGLNLCATIVAWGARPGRFRFVSFERYPLSVDDIATALNAWSDLQDVSEALCRSYQTDNSFTVGPADVEINTGDARETLPKWSGRADAWYLDGFSPAKNPELWEPTLLNRRKT
jgi:tRNA U34 5-methylaminomethyl-2-thiouridine-forming methyltransferase MnmC